MHSDNASGWGDKRGEGIWLRKQNKKKRQKKYKILKNNAKLRKMR